MRRIVVPHCGRQPIDPDTFWHGRHLLRFLTFIEFCLRHTNIVGSLGLALFCWPHGLDSESFPNPHSEWCHGSDGSSCSPLCVRSRGQNHIIRVQSLERSIGGSDLHTGKNMAKGPVFRGFVLLAFFPVLYSWTLVLVGSCGEKNGDNDPWRDQRTFAGSRWKKASKSVQGETACDAARSLRIQRLAEGEAADITRHIKTVLWYPFRSMNPVLW